MALVAPSAIQNLQIIFPIASHTRMCLTLYNRVIQPHAIIGSTRYVRCFPSFEPSARLSINQRVEETTVLSLPVEVSIFFPAFVAGGGLK